MVRQLIPHKLLKLTLFSALLLAAAPWSNVTAQEPGFHVNSFIPEKFTDLMLRVYGGFDIYGSDYERGEQDLSSGLYTIDDYESGSDSKTLSAGGSLLYRYETVPKFLTFGVDLYTSYRSYGQNRRSDQYSPNGNYYFYDDDEDTDEYRLRLQNYIDGAVYLMQDMFVSCRAEIGSDFRERSIDYIYVTGDTDPPDIFDDVHESSYRTEGTGSGHNKYYRLSLEILPGWGRIYEGGYASTAMYVVDELKSQGFLEKEPSYAEMTELTEIIYQYRLKHVIDSRLHRIEALTAIVDFLKQKGLVNDMHPAGSVIIQDVWDYFPNYYRPFGYRVRFGFGIEYSYGSYSSLSESDQHRLETDYNINTPDIVDTTLDTTYQYYSHYRDRSESSSPYLAMMFEYNNPINHRWQLNVGAQGRLYFKPEIDMLARDTVESYYYDSYQLIDRTTELKEYYTFGIGSNALYILNSRTTASFGAGYSMENIKREISEHRIADVSEIDTSYAFDAFTNWEFRVYASLNYRISIPTTLTAFIDYRRSSEQIENENTLDDVDRSNYQISASISHYIF